MEKNKTKVSIIIPTYGRSEMLVKTIQSVLNQTYKNLEIIIVDDNGLGTKEQKKTKSCISSFNDPRILYEPLSINSGGSYARNYGASLSSGEYICFLDDDDLFLPLKIEQQLLFMESHKEYVACYCNHIRHFLDTGERIEYKSSIEGEMLLPILRSEVDICSGSSLMLKREVFLTLNGFTSTLRRFQDLEFVARLSAIGKIGLIESPLLVIQTHKGTNDHKFFSNLERDGEMYIKIILPLIKDYPEEIIKEIIFLNNSNLLIGAIKLKSIRGITKYFFKSCTDRRFLFWFTTKIKKIIEK